MRRIRAVETASAVASFHEATYYGLMDPALREMHFGVSQNVAHVHVEVVRAMRLSLRISRPTRIICIAHRS